MNMRFVRAAIGCAAVAVCGALASAGTSVTKIDSTPARISTNFTVGKVNGVDSVVFVQPGLAGSPDRILALPLAGGTPLTIVGDAFGKRVSGKISHDGERVLFSSIDPSSGEAEILAAPATTSSGTILLTVRGSSFKGPSGAPAVRPSGGGPVVFKDVDATGGQVVVAQTAPGNVPITVIGSNFGPLSRPAASDDGHVAVMGSVPGSAGAAEPAVIIRPGPGNTLLTIRGDGWVNSPGNRVKFGKGELSPAVASVLTETPTGPQAIIAILTRKGYAAYQALAMETQGTVNTNPVHQDGDNHFDTSHYNGDRVATVSRGGQTNILARYPFHAALSRITIDTPALDPVPPGPGTTSTPGVTELELLKAGDLVGGLAVARIDISDASAYDEFNAVVALQLADGSSGFYIVSIPEPAALGLLVPTAAMLRRRRA